MFYLKINVWKIYPKAVVPNLFVTADRSMQDNFTAARGYSMMAALFQQPKWSYQYGPLSYYSTVCSIAPPPALSLYAPMLSPLTISTQQCFHEKNRQITCPDTCLFERGAIGTDGPFYNSILGNFIVYQDRIWNRFIEVIHPPRKRGMVFCNLYYYFWVNIVAE